MSAVQNAAEIARRHACHAANAPTDALRRYHQREVVLWARWLVTARTLSQVSP